MNRVVPEESIVRGRAPDLNGEVRPVGNTSTMRENLGRLDSRRGGWTITSDKSEKFVENIEKDREKKEKEEKKRKAVEKHFKEWTFSELNNYNISKGDKEKSKAKNIATNNAKRRILDKMKGDKNLDSKEWRKAPVFVPVKTFKPTSMIETLNKKRQIAGITASPFS
jgi:hypothetical protein